MSAQYRGDTSNNALASHLREQDDRLATLEVKMDAILNCLKWRRGDDLGVERRRRCLVPTRQRAGHHRGRDDGGLR
jgi:hypothetical protein